MNIQTKIIFKCQILDCKNRRDWIVHFHFLPTYSAVLTEVCLPSPGLKNTKWEVCLTHCGNAPQKESTQSKEKSALVLGFRISTWRLNLNFLPSVPHKGILLIVSFVINKFLYGKEMQLQTQKPWENPFSLTQVFSIPTPAERSHLRTGLLCHCFSLIWPPGSHMWVHSRISWQMWRLTRPGGPPCGRGRYLFPELLDPG